MIRKTNYEVEINLIDWKIKIIELHEKNLKIILLKKKNYDNIKIKKKSLNVCVLNCSICFRSMNDQVLGVHSTIDT